MLVTLFSLASKATNRLSVQTPPKGYKNPLYAVNRTGLWCPVLGQNPVYKAYDPQIEMQWAWCACNGPPQSEESCSLRAGVNPADLLQWQPLFNVGPSGAECVFPFTYNGTVYDTCADVNLKNPDPARRYGWCFSNVGCAPPTEPVR